MEGFKQEEIKGLLMRFLAMRETLVKLRSFMIENSLAIQHNDALQEIEQAEVHIQNLVHKFSGLRSEKFEYKMGRF